MNTTEQDIDMVLDEIESLVQNIRSDLECEDDDLINSQIQEVIEKTKNFRFLSSRPRCYTAFSDDTVTERDIQKLAILESRCRDIINEGIIIHESLLQLKATQPFDYNLILQLKIKGNTIGELPLSSNCPELFILKSIAQQVEPELLIADLLSVTTLGISLQVKITNHFLV